MSRRWIMLVAGVVSLAGLAADWPQWRGPERNGISAETGLLQEWPKEGPKLLWQATDLDGGFSTPAVAGDRLYVLTSKGKTDEYLQARRITDGKLVWSKRLGNVGPNQLVQYPGARSTATIDGALVYALGSDGDLVCFKAADGAEVWRKSLRRDFGGQPGYWAYSESPLIDGDVLVCTPGGKEATLVALDKKSGTVKWKSAVPGGDKAAYASIIIDNVGGLKQYVQFLANGVVGVDARTGKFLWRYAKTAVGSPANISTPVADGAYVYSGSGKGGGGLVKLTVADGSVKADPVYHERNLPTGIGGAIVLNHFLYGTGGSGLMCVDFATGKEKWRQTGGGAGSVCYADGRIYVHGENGSVALVDPSSDGYHEVGKFTPPNQPKRGGAKAWTYPVVANGRLYVRDLGMLWCYDLRK